MLPYPNPAQFLNIVTLNSAHRDRLFPGFNPGTVDHVKRSLGPDQFGLGHLVAFRAEFAQVNESITATAELVNMLFRPRSRRAARPPRAGCSRPAWTGRYSHASWPSARLSPGGRRSPGWSGPPPPAPRPRARAGSAPIDDRVPPCPYPLAPRLLTLPRLGIDLSRISMTSTFSRRLNNRCAIASVRLVPAAFMPL